MKDAIALQQELARAKSLVQVGDLYYHYKHPERHYQIISIAFLESTEEVSVVYQSLYAPYLSWVRTVSNFLETLTVDDKMISRFKKFET